jgi:hypothetical protein
MAALVASLFLLVAPVSADTAPFIGTSFASNSEQCVTTGAITTCTDLFLNVSQDTSGTQTCLDRYAFALITTGKFLFRSESSGCTSAGNLVIGGNGSVNLASTAVTLLNCDHRRCVRAATYTVSASDIPSGAPTTTTTVETTTTGACITITDVFTPLTGSITLNGTAIPETGGLDVSTSDTPSPCP